MRMYSDLTTASSGVPYHCQDWWSSYFTDEFLTRLGERLVKFGKAEAATRPMIRKLLLEYETGGGMDNPTGLWHAWQGFCNS